MSTAPLTILIVDDHAVLRTGLRLLLEGRRGLKVVGEAADPIQSLELARTLEPQVILLDLDLGGLSGLDLIEPLRKAAPVTRILVLTGIRDPETHREAVRRGARGVVPKEKAAELLLKAIEKVGEGEIWIDRSMVASLIDEISQPRPVVPSDPDQARIASLTPREREVIALLSEGLRNKDIGERLFISETTVRHHLTSIFAKLNVPDRLGLILYAFRHGLADPPTGGA